MAKRQIPIIHPVGQHAERIVVEWADELSDLLQRPRETLLAERRLRVGDFGEILKITLMDGSYVVFKHAIAIHSESKKAIAVFTEHCGYHVFPHHEAAIEVMPEGYI